MSAVDLVPADATTLDRVTDPAEAVVVYLERAKVWLTQATDVVDVVEVKARAEAMRVYVTQKELARDAEVAATEMVRRAERRIGELLAEKMRAGEITGRGGDRRSNSAPGSLTDVGISHNESSQFQTLASVPDEEFEEALDEAKAEDNPSRANLLRKVKKAEERAQLNEDVKAQREWLDSLPKPKDPERNRVDAVAMTAADTFVRAVNDLQRAVTPDRLRQALCDSAFPEVSVADTRADFLRALAVAGTYREAMAR